MVKGMYYYLRENYKNLGKDEVKQRMTEWRKAGAIVRLEKPSRLDKARMLGYKAKKGIVVVRVKLLRGGRRRRRPRKGRRSKRMTPRKTLQMNYREVAEQRAARKYINMEVVNSYFIGKDGMNFFYEVILADRDSPDLKSDRQIAPLINSPRGRAFRGLTSAGTKARGLRKELLSNLKKYKKVKNRRKPNEFL